MFGEHITDTSGVFFVKGIPKFVKIWESGFKVEGKRISVFKYISET